MFRDKIEKKINQEKNKNIAIKRMKTIGLKNQIE
jgi:hypothetical protein